MFEIEFEGQVIAVDPASLVVDEWSQVALELAGFAARTGTEPDVEVKAAAVALIVARRRPQLAALPFTAFVDAPEVVQRSSIEDLPLAQKIELLQGMGV